METLPVPLRFSPITLAALAREIATEINELPVILQHFGISEEEYAALQQNNSFQAILQSAIAEWKSATNAEKRIEVQALAGIEDAMTTVVARMGNKDEPLNHVVEAGKWLKSLTNINADAKGAQGEKFIINIQLGADEEKHVVDITPRQVDEIPAIQSLPEGESPEPAVRPIPEGSGSSS